ncbi:hypothetical protein [Burkholderia gladioli]|uniref:hypothetical protein n=1 Tax=Burkholderia gladioli TaxID=28095 RepID=UPI002FE13928
MDYVLANFIAALAAVVFSVFTSFIASRSGRPIYRKIMWSYLAILLISAIVVTVLQLSIAVLIFGALFSCILTVFVQVAMAVKMGHLTMTSGSYLEHRDRFGAHCSAMDDIRYHPNTRR